MGDTGSKPPGSRRVGDETRKRIDDLAGGWSVGSKPSPDPTPDDGETERVPRQEFPEDGARAAPPPPPAPRSKPLSSPPPIPAKPPPTPPRTKPPTAPPRTKPPTPPPGRSAPLQIRSASERRDQTSPEADDATILQIDAPGPTAAPARGLRAREPVALPRERGVLGDMRYVFAALFGVARARSELAQIEGELAKERGERERSLITVARYTVGQPGYDQPMVERARDALAAIEERRSQHAGAVAAADEEVAGLERARAAAREAHEAEDKRYATELQAIATKLAPLEKSAADVRKKLNAVKVTAAALEKRIKSEERKLVAVSKKDDPGAVEANLASVRAEREAVLADEPALAAELDEIEPKIAGLSGSRAEIEGKRAAAREAEETDAQRTAEKITAAEARRQVEQNAVGDTDRECDRALLELGERLDVDRPGDIADKLRGADEHAIAIATLERKHIELGELVSGVDRMALARGVGYWLVVLAAVVGVAWLVVSHV